MPDGWFCALLDTAPDVYFRYALVPARRFAYVSPAVQTLTGRSPGDFYADAGLCLSLIAGEDRRRLRQVLRSRRGVAMRLHIVRDGVTIPVELHTVALVRRRRVVAVEGVVRLAVGAAGDGLQATGYGLRAEVSDAGPVQQRLAALMVEVHDLLHRVLPPEIGRGRQDAGSRRSNVLTLGDLALDCDRLVVTESGRVVELTSREVMVLRYLLERPGRVVTRQHLLTDVWSYAYR